MLFQGTPTQTIICSQAVVKGLFTQDVGYEWKFLSAQVAQCGQLGLIKCDLVAFVCEVGTVCKKKKKSPHKDFFSMPD